MCVCGLFACFEQNAPSQCCGLPHSSREDKHTQNKKHDFADTDMAARRTTAADWPLTSKTRGPHKKTSPPAENNRPKSRRALPQGLGGVLRAVGGVGEHDVVAAGSAGCWGILVAYGRAREFSAKRKRRWISKSTREVDGEGFLISGSRR